MDRKSTMLLATAVALSGAFGTAYHHPEVIRLGKRKSGTAKHDLSNKPKYKRSFKGSKAAKKGKR